MFKNATIKSTYTLLFIAVAGIAAYLVYKEKFSTQAIVDASGNEQGEVVTKAKAA